MSHRRRLRGFTLVELLVALFALSLLAALCWRGLDGMVRAREQTQARADELLTLQIAMEQWSADLDALVLLPGMKALDWNGRVLRMTRRGTTSPTEGVLVVGWARRTVNGTSMWSRWQSPAATTRGDLEQAWLRADQWAQNPGDDARAGGVAITPLADWQIYFFRDNAWTNPQSSDVTSNSIIASTAAVAAPAAAGASARAPAAPPTAQNLPDGVRIVLAVPPGPAISGTLVRDWARPLIGGKAS
jgi:general secretion pathway protein J